MLHTETIAGTTLQLLRDLQTERPMKPFCLAGGTALALYLGHRKSVDLDFFTPFPFDTPGLKEFLETKYNLRTDFMAKNTLKGSIDNIKIDCITHAYEYLEKPHQEENIKLYSKEDIIAMKLSAIADNGTRLKDFIDIAFLSKHFSFYSMLKCYNRKFPESDMIRPFKAITYWEDIDFDEDIVMLAGTYSWENIKKRLVAMSVEQDKIFESYPFP